MHNSSGIFALVLLLLGAMVVAGCSQETVLEPEPTSQGTGLFAPVAVTSARDIIGEIGPGARYGLFVPADWNGDLVLYAHGFKDSASPVDLPTADHIIPLRDELVALGYAVAYSSYSENGLAVKDGAQRTQQLRGIFVSRVGRPARTYLMGHSLGGLVAIMLAEKHPEHYAGAIPMCGMIGGSKAEIDYIGHLRTLFDFFYPGVLPGNTMDLPENADLMTDVVLAAMAAIQQNPTGAGAIAAIDQIPVPFTNAQELGESIIRGLGFHFRGFADVVARTHGHVPFGNSETVYTGSLPPELLAAINEGVGRFEATPDALNYLERFYKPGGNLKVPVLSLHNRWDPVVPLFHENIYGETVSAENCSEYLVQRTVDLYGHCRFGETRGEGVQVMIQALLDLVAWVEDGVTPVP